MRKRIISLVLVICIVISLLVIPAAAAETTATADELAGTWVFNDTLDVTVLGMASLSVNLDFVSNNTSYNQLAVSSGGMQGVLMAYTGPDIGLMAGTIYTAGSFREEAYKTVVISTTFDELSASSTQADLFLTFMQANATKQVEQRSVKIYEDGLILDSSIVPDGSMLNITTTGYNILAPNGTTIVNRVMSSSSNMLFCGLTADSAAEVATYGPGTSLKVTQDLTYYMVIKETYNVTLYTQDGTFFDVIKCPVGQTAITINLGSLYFNLWNGNDFTYDLNLGSGEMVLGLSSSRSDQYAYDWGVGETIYVTGSTNLYIVKSYPYPVALYYNAGVVMKYFTGFQGCSVRVNEDSIDFISNEGVVETFAIPMKDDDDVFWGLATTPKQKTPTYRPGSVISVFDTTELFIVRKSDYNKLVEDEFVYENEELDADTSSLKDIFKRFKSFIKTNVSSLKIIEIFINEDNYSWFTVETAIQLDMVPSSVSTFSFDDVESDYEKYNMQAYDERLNLLMSFMGGDDE